MILSNKFFQLIEEAKVGNISINDESNIEDLPESVPLGENVPWTTSDKIFCLVGDYCQNMGIPNLGEEQSRETYYYSPKSVYCFGMANVGIEKPTLYTYIYPEEVGKKGGNNVALLVMKHIFENNIAQQNVTAKELTLIFENCPGQNKNNHVIRLVNYLVQKKYFKHARVVFLVKGHTKNVCDRFFNLLKISYNKRNVYTYQQLLQTCDEVDLVNVRNTSESDFKDWYGMMNIHYKTITDGEVLKNYVFYASSENSHIIYIKEHHEATITIEQDLRRIKIRKRTRDEEKNRIISEWCTNVEQDKPNEIEAPGLADIKKAELFCKWRELIPEPYRDDICPHPGEDVLEKVKNSKKKKKKKNNDKSPEKRKGET